MSQLDELDKLLQRVAHAIDTDDELETYFSSHYTLSEEVHDKKIKEVYNLASHFAQDEDSWTKFQNIVKILKGEK